MSKYTEEFRLMLVELAESGHPTAALSKEYNVDRSSINKWRQAYKGSKTTLISSTISPEQLQIQELTKQVKELQLERDILKKAVRIFSKNE